MDINKLIGRRKIGLNSSELPKFQAAFDKIVKAKIDIKATLSVKQKRLIATNLTSLSNDLETAIGKSDSATKSRFKKFKSSGYNLAKSDPEMHGAMKLTVDRYDKIMAEVDAPELKNIDALMAPMRRLLGRKARPKSKSGVDNTIELISATTNVQLDTILDGLVYSICMNLEALLAFITFPILALSCVGLVFQASTLAAGQIVLPRILYNKLAEFDRSVASKNRIIIDGIRKYMTVVKLVDSISGHFSKDKKTSKESDDMSQEAITFLAVMGTIVGLKLFVGVARAMVYRAGTIMVDISDDIRAQCITITIGMRDLEDAIKKGDKSKAGLKANKKLAKIIERQQKAVSILEKVADKISKSEVRDESNIVNRLSGDDDDYPDFSEAPEANDEDDGEIVI